MDPQQKMLLEVVYEAIEAAGYSMHALRGSQTGVFVGQMNDDFKDSLYRDLDIAPQYTATGISRAITANRVSYFFDWRGPSVNLDTACSSSLVALHQAVQSLRSGDISMAVAAGLNLILGPESFVLQSKVSGSTCTQLRSTVGFSVECFAAQGSLTAFVDSFTCCPLQGDATCGMQELTAMLAVRVSL
jgi:acyl transferase domain-containing protein